MQPRVSFDGRWLIYECLGVNRPTIMKMALNGGRPAPVSDAHALFPTPSSDGNWIAFYQLNLGQEAGMEMAILPFNGGPVRKIFPLPPGTVVEAGLAWSRDNHAMLYAQSRNGADNIFAQPVSGGAPTQVTHFESDRIFNFALSPHGDQLAVARGTINSDVVMINFNK